MITNLAYKEFVLSIPRLNYIWLAAVLLLLIPQWPFVIVFAYLFFGFFTVLNQFDKVNNDLTFCAVLPIPKTAVVSARTLTMVIVEAAMVVVSVPLALARHWLWSGVNLVMSMNVNLAFYGLIFVMFGAYNAIYLTGTYRRAYKMVWPLIGGMAIATPIGLALTVAVGVIPGLAFLNDPGLGNLGAQLVVLIVGLMVWTGATWLGWRHASAKYELVDL